MLEKLLRTENEDGVSGNGSSSSNRRLTLTTTANDVSVYARKRARTEEMCNAEWGTVCAMNAMVSGRRCMSPVQDTSNLTRLLAFYFVQTDLT